MTHVGKKYQVAMWNLHRIKTIRDFLDQTPCATLKMSLVISHIHYAKCILTGVTDKVINKATESSEHCSHSGTQNVMFGKFKWS